MRQNWRYHPPAEDRRCQSPSRPILRGFWASSCPRGMNGRLSVMKKRLCAEDPSTPNPTHWWLPWCLSVASLPCGPPLTPESQPTATVPSAPANQHYLDFSSVHRAVERYADNASQTSCRQSLFSQIRMAVSGCSLSTSRLAPACHVSSTDSVSVQRGAYLTVPDGDPAARGASHTVVYRHNAESWPELLRRVGWRDLKRVS